LDRFQESEVSLRKLNKKFPQAPQEKHISFNFPDFFVVYFLHFYSFLFRILRGFEDFYSCPRGGVQVTSEFIFERTTKQSQ